MTNHIDDLKGYAEEEFEEWFYGALFGRDVKFYVNELRDIDFPFQCEGYAEENEWFRERIRTAATGVLERLSKDIQTPPDNYESLDKAMHEYLIIVCHLDCLPTRELKDIIYKLDESRHGLDAEYPTKILQHALPALASVEPLDEESIRIFEGHLIKAEYASACFSGILYNDLIKAGTLLPVFARIMINEGEEDILEDKLYFIFEPIDPDLKKEDLEAFMKAYENSPYKGESDSEWLSDWFESQNIRI